MQRLFCASGVPRVVIAYLRAMLCRKSSIPAGAAASVTATNGATRRAPEDEYAI